MSRQLTLGDWLLHRQDRIAQWFTEHRAAYATGQVGPLANVEYLRWAKPGTGMYGITYLCTGGTLVVTGDLFDAIYQAGGSGLKWWSSCDLSYFAGKCIASPSGRGFEVWDRDYAAIAVRDRLKDDEETRDLFEQHNGGRFLSSQHEWSEWLHADGPDVFGGDYFELGGIGMVVDQLCESHLAGLKSAMAQLAERVPSLAGVS